MTTHKAIILGCGNSSGTPSIGGYWGACDPEEPRNRRTRTSMAIVTAEGKTLLFDTGPDFKQQFDRHALSVPEAVIYTHAHSDHISGIDELRWLAAKQKKPMDVYSSSESISELQHRFTYMFDNPRPDMYPQMLEAHEWSHSDFYKDHELAGLKFTLLPLDHETVTSCGFRFGDFAYTTDLVRMDDKVLNAIKGVKTWVVDCGAYKNTQNPAHACLDDIYCWNEIVGAQQVYFTAMAPGMDYQTVLAETPDGYAPAYDGLEIEFIL